MTATKKRNIDSMKISKSSVLLLLFQKYIPTASLDFVDKVRLVVRHADRSTQRCRQRHRADFSFSSSSSSSSFAALAFVAFPLCRVAPDFPAAKQVHNCQLAACLVGSLQATPPLSVLFPILCCCLLRFFLFQQTLVDFIGLLLLLLLPSALASTVKQHRRRDAATNVASPSTTVSQSV
ncbi:hypothetical protein Tsp_08215 [Trichinella spiralis]|uniref:hypothetical protein n=1 Tax=Trichinella spiralis TaxID=6334 RepID=UPI0001EFEA4F|nr:hypothetical protein Tsp_08215 [Trichinella spiralis]